MYAGNVLVALSLVLVLRPVAAAPGLSHGRGRSNSPFTVSVDADDVSVDVPMADAPLSDAVPELLLADAEAQVEAEAEQQPMDAAVAPPSRLVLEQDATKIPVNLIDSRSHQCKVLIGFSSGAESGSAARGAAGTAAGAPPAGRRALAHRPGHVSHWFVAAPMGTASAAVGGVASAGPPALPRDVTPRPTAPVALLIAQANRSAKKKQKRTKKKQNKTRTLLFRRQTRDAVFTAQCFIDEPFIPITTIHPLSLDVLALICIHFLISIPRALGVAGGSFA